MDGENKRREPDQAGTVPYTLDRMPRSYGDADEVGSVKQFGFGSQDEVGASLCL